MWISDELGADSGGRGAHDTDRNQDHEQRELLDRLTDTGVTRSATGAQAKPVVAILIGLYLAAIVAANLIAARFGPTASIYNAFALIGFDLITRDRLADFWGTTRWAKMGS